MAVRIKKVAILGCGLIGGAIALDLQKHGGRSLEIVAYDRPGTVRSLAGNKRFTGRATGKIKEAVEDAGIIILSASLSANEKLLNSVADIRPLADCLIMDVGGVKQPVADLARSLRFPDGVQFLPTHPMAGKETAGFDNAEHDIFRGHTWFVDDTVQLSSANQDRLIWLLNKTGAVPAYISSALHDDLIAEISHLPQLISTVLGAQVNPDLLELSGPGLRSMLRLSGSPYTVWSELIDQNRENIVEALTVYRDNLNAVLEVIENRKSLKDVFAAAARSYRCLS